MYSSANNHDIKHTVKNLKGLGHIQQKLDKYWIYRKSGCTRVNSCQHGIRPTFSTAKPKLGGEQKGILKHEVIIYIA